MAFEREFASCGHSYAQECFIRDSSQAQLMRSCSAVPQCPEAHQREEGCVVIALDQTLLAHHHDQLVTLCEVLHCVDARAIS